MSFTQYFCDTLTQWAAACFTSHTCVLCTCNLRMFFLHTELNENKCSGSSSRKKFIDSYRLQVFVVQHSLALASIEFCGNSIFFFSLWLKGFLLSTILLFEHFRFKNMLKRISSSQINRVNRMIGRSFSIKDDESGKVHCKTKVEVNVFLLR